MPTVGLEEVPFVEAFQQPNGVYLVLSWFYWNTTSRQVEEFRLVNFRAQTITMRIVENGTQVGAVTFASNLVNGQIPAGWDTDPNFGTTRRLPNNTLLITADGAFSRNVNVSFS